VAYELIVIGASQGGLRALQTLLAALSPNFTLPVAIVQHRDKGATDLLSAILQKHSPLKVAETMDKEAIMPGRVYLAPSDYHLLVEESYFTLSTGAPVWYARPSIDVLFESAADSWAGKVIGVILTGASRDGARGLAAIKEGGGLTIVQDPSTAESPTLPEAALATTAVDRILPLAEIGPFLTDFGHSGRR
jgi:CheB methylesterase